MDPLLQMSVELAKAHLTASPIESSKISALIQDIYRTLKGLSDESGAPNEAASPQARTANESASRSGEPAIVNADTSGPDFEGLESWLAARLPRRIARQLNREPSVHPSVFPDYLVCLEDGEKVKLLRPWIRNRFGMSMTDYIDRWNLPADYPVAPPSFIAAKRQKAKAFGLGVTTRGPRGPAKQRASEKGTTRSRKRSAKV